MPEHDDDDLFSGSKPWSEVAHRFEQRYPGVSPDYMRQRYEGVLQMRRARQRLPGTLRREQEEETGPESFAAQNPVASVVHDILPAIPFARAVTSLERGGDHHDWEEAHGRVIAGTADRSDYEAAARHEHRLAQEQNQGWGSYLGEQAMNLPAMAGEYLLGGAAVRGGAALAGARATSWLYPAATAGTAARVGGLAARQTLGAPAQMASSWVEDFAHRGGRVRDLPPALGLAAVNNIVLGSVGEIAGPAGARWFVRAPAAAAIGMGEQQAADTLTSWMGLNTGYGTIGELYRNPNRGLQHAAGQALTFGLFALLHTPGVERPAAAPRPEAPAEPGATPTPEGPTPGPEPPPQAPPEVLRSFADLLRSFQRSGMSSRAARETIQKEFADPLRQGFESNPTPTPEEVRGWFNRRFANEAMGRFADTLAEAVGRERPSETAPEAPPASEYPSTIPEAAQTAEVAPQGQPEAPRAIEGTPEVRHLTAPEQQPHPEPGRDRGQEQAQQPVMATTPPAPEQPTVVPAPSTESGDSVSPPAVPTPEPQRPASARPRDLTELFDRAELSEPERQVVLNLFEGQTNQQAAGGRNRETARKRIAKIADKLGLPQSFFRTLEGGGGGNISAEQWATMERSVGFSKEELRDPAVRAAVDRAKAPLNDLERLQRQLDKLAKKFLKATTPEERADLEQQAHEIAARIRGDEPASQEAPATPSAVVQGEGPGPAAAQPPAQGAGPPAAAANPQGVGPQAQPAQSPAEVPSPTPRPRRRGRAGAVNLEPIAEFGDDVQKFLAPASRGPEARTGAGVIRESLAEMVRRQEIAKAALSDGAAYFDRWMPADPAMRSAGFLQFFDAMESGQHGNLPTPLRDFADTMRRLIDERTDLVRNRGLVTSFLNNYVGHLWKKRGSTLTPEEIGRMMGSRRPLSGREGFRKERIYDTFRDGINAGLEPIDWNPARLVLRTLEQVDKAVMGRDVVDQLALQGLWEFKRLGDKVPEGWRQIDDKLATVFKPRQPGGAGPELVGHYYTPEPIARLLDNYLTPGLRGNRVYDAIRGFGNLLNQFQLGFSAFHLGFVAIDTQVSAVALGLQRLSRGDVAGAATQLAKAPIEPFLAMMRGNDVLHEYYKPGSQGAEIAAIVDHLMEAGGRARMDEFYGGTHLDSFRRALREAQGGSVAATGSALWHALPALSEAVSYPVMQMVVPRMKLAVFADLARFEMSRLGPTATADQRRQAMGRVWDSVENRLGQMTYDNVFWNRTLKDVLMASVRSVGWNLGTWREIGGGVVDIPKSAMGAAKGQGISPRLAYILGLVGVTGLYGALYQFLATGKPPEEMKDLFFPRTGNQRPDGTEDRVAIPSYMRDIQQLINRGDEGPIRLVQNVGEMARHKINPGLTVAGEMLFNRDFYDHPIRNANDPAVQQAGDTAMHLLRSFESFSVRAMHDPRQQQRSTAERTQSFFSITPASSSVTRTWEQQRAIESRHGLR